LELVLDEVHVRLLLDRRSDHLKDGPAGGASGHDLAVDELTRRETDKPTGQSTERVRESSLSENGADERTGDLSAYGPPDGLARFAARTAATHVNLPTE
jgi:hypothetical protein